VLSLPLSLSSRCRNIKALACLSKPRPRSRSTSASTSSNYSTSVSSSEEDDGYEDIHAHTNNDNDSTSTSSSIITREACDHFFSNDGAHDCSNGGGKSQEETLLTMEDDTDMYSIIDHDDPLTRSTYSFLWASLGDDAAPDDNANVGCAACDTETETVPAIDEAPVQATAVPTTMKQHHQQQQQQGTKITKKKMMIHDDANNKKKNHNKSNTDQTVSLVAPKPPPKQTTTTQLMPLPSLSPELERTFDTIVPTPTTATFRTMDSNKCVTMMDDLPNYLFSSSSSIRNKREYTYIRIHGHGHVLSAFIITHWLTD
jgi:hypothetical protein